MKSRFLHANLNVTAQERSNAFYREALGLTEISRRQAKDGSYVLVFLGDGETLFRLELTWLRDHKGKYELGENESHIAFGVPDKATAHALHEKMGCICYENPGMGIYFIEDPDGYWLEIIG